MRKTEDRSVLALLYDEYRRTYPESIDEMQREVEHLYQELHHHHLANPEEIAVIFNVMCDDRARYAYEEGIKCGVRLALDLELDCRMFGGGTDVFDC